MEVIWKNLPYEIISMILEQLCLIRLKKILEENKYGFLLEKIKKYKCLISGSILIQCILGVCYENSNIDVYIKYIYSEPRLRDPKNEKIIEKLFQLPDINPIDKTNYEKYKDMWKICVNGYFVAVTESSNLSKYTNIDEKIICNPHVPTFWKKYHSDKMIILCTAGSYYYVHNTPSQFIEEEIYESMELILDMPFAYSSPNEDIYKCIKDDSRIKYTRDFGSPNKFQINTICLDVVSLYKFITYEFDADICSISYDGENFSENFCYLSKKILNNIATFRINKKWSKNTVFKFHELRKKKHKSKKKVKFIKTCERIKKYISRGFLIKIEFY